MGVCTLWFASNVRLKLPLSQQRAISLWCHSLQSTSPPDDYYLSFLFHRYSVRRRVAGKRENALLLSRDQTWWDLK